MQPYDISNKYHTITVAAWIHDLRQFNKMRGDHFIRRDVIVAQLKFDAIAKWRKHVGEIDDLAPLRVVVFLGRGLVL